MTGVQTCALPIFDGGKKESKPTELFHALSVLTEGSAKHFEGFEVCDDEKVDPSAVSHNWAAVILYLVAAGVWPVDEEVDQYIAKYLSNRSEDGRVGKECRSRWSPYL